MARTEGETSSSNTAVNKFSISSQTQGMNSIFFTSFKPSLSIFQHLCIFFCSHMKVSHVLKTNNEEYRDTWNATLPMQHSPMRNSMWPNFSNQHPTTPRTDTFNMRQIVAPPKLLIKDNTSIQSTDSLENSVRDNDEVPPSNESFDKIISWFGKSSLQDETSKNIFKENSTTKNDKTSYEGIVNKQDIFNLPKTNNFDGKRKQTRDTSELKKKLRSLVAIQTEKRSKMWICWSFVFVILFAVVISLLLNMNTSGFCSPQFRTNSIPQELKDHIHGQDAAVNELAKYFIKQENQTVFDVITLVGGTGVGKSYTAEIIKSNLKDTANILDIFPPLYNKEDQVLTSLSVCRCNLIRVENLKTVDISDATEFVNGLHKRYANYCILALLLFNPQETDSNLERTLNLEESISMIEKTFEEANLQSMLVSFLPLSDETLTKCIRDAAEFTHVKLSNDDVEYVRRDLLKADAGCKGAYPKVQLVGTLERPSLFDPSE